jgi:hypothetical protein
MALSTRILPMPGTLLSLLLVTGCRHHYPHSALVVDEIISAPRAVPAIHNDLDLKLVAVDGQPVEREQPYMADAWLCAVVAPGTHSFRLSVAPIPRPAGFAPYEVVISATVEEGKSYGIVSQSGRAYLMECRF